MLLILCATLVVVPEWVSRVWLGPSLGFGVLTVATLAWLLLGIHRRLVEEKERWLGENAERWQESLQELHQSVDNRDLAANEQQ